MGKLKLSTTILPAIFGLAFAMLIVSAAARDSAPATSSDAISIGTGIDRTTYLGSGWGLELRL